MSAFSDAFDTLYAGVPAPMSASDPLPLDTFTTRGCGLRRSSGRNASVVRHAPKRLVSSARVDAVEVGGRRAGVGVVVDRGVVDERVAAPERVGHPRRRGGDARVVGDVEGARDDPRVRTAERRRRVLAAAGVAGAEHDAEARAREGATTSRPMPRLAPVTTATGSSSDVTRRS